MSRTVVSRRDVEDRAVEPAEETFGFSPLEGPPGPSRTRPSGDAPSPSGPGEEPDSYVTKLMKYIPAEVIALYIAFDAVVRSVDDPPTAVRWLVFAVCVFGTYWYLSRAADVHKRSQLVISVVAFCVWAFALGGPFALLGWYRPFYGALVLPGYTFFIGTVEA